MDRPGGLEPVVLRISRRTPITYLSFIAVAGVVLLGVGILTEGETRWQALSFSGLCLAGLIFLLIEWGVAGRAGLEMRLDSAGVSVGRRRIPWKAVQSARWSGSAIHKGHVWKPGIVLHLRDVEGYKAPRAATESIDHIKFRVSANLLLDAIVRYAYPHAVHVVAVDPGEPWPLSQSPTAD